MTAPGTRARLAAWAERHRLPLGIAAAVAAGALAVLWTQVVPAKAAAASPVQAAAITYGHPLCWALLAAAAALHALRADPRWSRALATAALAAYAVFLAGLAL